MEELRQRINTIKDAWSQINNGQNNNIEDYTIINKHTDKYNSGMFAFKDAESIIQNLQGKSVNVRNQIRKLFKQDTYYSSLKEDRKKLVKQLEEKNKMENKIKVCSELFNNLNLNQMKIEKFSYENVNVFLFFLEAIALEDSPHLSKDYLEKIKNEIIGSDNLALAKTIRNDLFLHCNYERVVEKVNLDQEMAKLFKANISCRTFFRRLRYYVSQVDGKLKSDRVQSYSVQLDHEPKNFLKTINEIEDMQTTQCFGRVLNSDKIQGKLSKLFKNCIKQIGNKPNVAKGEEIMFNLTVNIMPILGKMYSESRNKLSVKGLEEIRKFRNEFFHNFHAHGDSSLQRNLILKQGIHKLLDYFFKYYFSRKVFKEFKNLTPACSSQQTIEQKISKLLQRTQDNFKKYYLANESNNVEPVVELTRRGVESNLTLSNFVCEYLKLMSVIDNEYVIKEREVRRKKNKNQVINRELKSIDRKRIYNKFKMLKESFKADNKNDNKKQLIRGLRKRLRTEYGIWIPELYLKQMFEYYVISDNPLTISQFEIVNNDVCALISIRDDYKLPTQKVIAIYDKFIKGEEIFNLLELKLTTQQKSSIEEKLGSLKSRRNKSINLSSDFNVENDKGKKIDGLVDVVKTTRNLLEMLDDHILYPFLSMTIEEMFSDEIFLDYLLNEKIDITQDFLTKFLKVEYITPYVIELIIANKLTQGVITTQGFSNIIENSKNNIQNMYCLFKNPKHVAEILGALSNNSGKIELVKEAFRLLKNTVDKLYSNEEYDLVLELLEVEEVDSIKNVLLSKDSSDLDVLHVQRTMARVKNQKGCYKDALEIFTSIQGKIQYVENLNTLHDSSRMEDIELNKLYLLVSSDIAYTKHLMGNYEDSNEEYKILYDRVMKLAINSDVSKLSYEIYDNILKSEKYLNILALDSKYLNILKIRSDIAYELTSLANAKQKSLPNKRLQDETKFNEVLQHYQDALNIYEEVYEIKRTDAVVSQDIVKNIRDIAFVNNNLASLKSSNHKNEVRLNQTLSHYNKAFEMYARVLTIQEKEQWETHPANSRTVQDILHAARNIAYTHNKLGDLKLSISNPEEALRHYKEALVTYEEALEIQNNLKHEHTLNTLRDIAHTNNNLGRLKSQDNPVEALEHYKKASEIYEKVLEIQNNNLDKEHEHTLNTLRDIAHTNNNLGRLKSQDNPIEALKHYEKASKIYKEVLEIQIRTLGEEHDKTKKTKKKLEDTKAWMNK
ncbi:uncharacterized protein LOC105278802 isoform X2 [Ooceraea biroi]|nr:uncharacterized protein LOC105278802 isoform X2 [Ooceraea biroi]